MTMNAGILKANLKSDFNLIFNICKEGAGMSPEDYADMVAEACASRFVEHITEYAEVNGTWKVT
jgi:hypothetical protein